MINQDSISHVARALGDIDPLYTDPTYAMSSRFGAQVAPPALLYGVAWGSWDLRRGLQVPGVTAMHAGDSWHYLRPALAGDTLTATKTTVRCDPAQSRTGAPRLFQTDRIDIRNQRDEIVAVQQMSTIRVERHSAVKGDEPPRQEKAKYSAAELDELDAEVLVESPRGGDTRYWEDVEVGDRLEPIVKGPLTQADMLAWIQAVGSAHVRSGRFWVECRRETPELTLVDDQGVPQPVERMHWDESSAAGTGVLTAFDYGAQRAGYATYAATRWAGDDGWLAALDVQYRGMVFYGDILRISGEVVDRWRGTQSGVGYVTIRIAAVTNRFPDVMPGTITVALPSRTTGPLPLYLDASTER
jgi:acyl dehydratase